MSPLRTAVDEYLALRQGLGFSLQLPGALLRDFATFLEREGASHITRELALRWAQHPATAQPAHWARRLSTVRRFAQFWSASDQRTEVPPLGVLPYRSERGARLTQGTVRWTFNRLSRRIGLRGPADRRGPRLHDLRHRLAVTTLLRWYRAGMDVERHLPALSTYLGHGHVADTYWYVSAVPELLRLAAARLEARGGRS